MSQSKVPLYLTLLAGCILSAGLILFRSETLSLANAALAIAIAWLGFAPSLKLLKRPLAHQSCFPLMQLTGLFYGLFFGLSSFAVFYLVDHDLGQIEYYKQRYIDSISLEAQWIALLGLASMFLTWGLSKKYLFGKLPVFRVAPSQNIKVTLIIAWGLALSNLAYYIFPEIRSLPSVGQFLQPGGFLAFALFYLLNADNKLGRLVLYPYFFVALPCWLAYLIASGSLTSVILFLTLWISLRFSVIGSIPKLVLIVPLFLLIVYPNVHEYRGKYWVNGETGSVVSKVLAFGTFVVKGVTTTDTNPLTRDRPTQGLVRRLSLILPLSHVVETTPDQVPYWRGATYQTLFTGWIPRVFWKDKPEEVFGNEFGRRYNIIASEDKSNSINIPWLTEMYANFGRIGVLLGMAFVGLFLGVLERFLNSPNRNLSERAVGATVLLPLFFQESNFTLMTGSLIPLLLCFWLLLNVGHRFNELNFLRKFKG